MLNYEEMKSDVVFSKGSDVYTCNSWCGVSTRRADNKDILIITTQLYDKQLYNFIDTQQIFDISFDTSVKNQNMEEEYTLKNTLDNMRLLLHQSSFNVDEVTKHIFVFGNHVSTDQDAYVVVNEEIKEEIVNEVVRILIKEINKRGIL